MSETNRRDRNDLTLKERCKLVVWMDQFKSSEIVRLKYKKEFDKNPPKESVIEDVFQLFVSTGSVYGALPTERISKDPYTPLEDADGGPGMCIKDEEEDDEGRSMWGNKEEIQLYPAMESEGEVMVCNLAVSEDGAVLKMQEHLKEEGKKETGVGDAEGEGFEPPSSGWHKTRTKEQQQRHLQQKGREFFQCSSCSFASNSSGPFRAHRRSCCPPGGDRRPNTTTGDRRPNNTTGDSLMTTRVADVTSYACGQCGRAYSTPGALRMHQAFHSKLRPLGCGKCDYRFFSPAALAKHLRAHDKVQHLECPHCTYKSNMSGNMIVHARTHSGEQPYRCPVCGFRTGNPSVHKRHLETHNLDPTYRCQQCHYRTGKRVLLARHQAAHHHHHHSGKPPLECHVCQSRFETPYALRYHVTKWHSEREALECPFCDFRQSDKALLKVHIRRHTGERPYGCPRGGCGFRAMRSQDLKRHALKAHG